MPITPSEMSKLLRGNRVIDGVITDERMTLKELLELRESHIKALEEFYKTAVFKKMVSAWNLGYNGSNTQALIIVEETEWNSWSEEEKGRYWRIEHFDQVEGPNGEQLPPTPGSLLGLPLRILFDDS